MTIIFMKLWSYGTFAYLAAFINGVKKLNLIKLVKKLSSVKIVSKLRRRNNNQYRSVY